MTEQKKNKYDFLNYLLGEGDVMVCLDARKDCVDIPKDHKNNPSLSLIFNLNFRRPFEVTPEGIYATLAFGGRPHKCIIPFEAVWAIYEPGLKQGQVWEEDFPKDIDPTQYSATAMPSSQKTGAPGRKKSPAKPEKPKRDRSHLRVIK
ncbi:MAG: hypothetical protein G3M78_01385 [Candidatus Nitrohelix vancouverensis]|uniref:Stringent starvation protein B n=1 Tax=Candidatus Nitrohelix vancouverensis TaxID=2705534 RepID=A0A7T0C093_9BACT|nr:MAG: hypothetical protein G3M78_01385 [Candidatus Nitrohelix vancouverensis]